MNRPTTLSYQPASLAHAQAMAELSRDLIETGLAWRYTRVRMAAFIRDPDTIALAAVDGAALHGFAVMQFADSTAHLALLCVRPTQHRRGIATRLLEWLIESAQVAGIEAIRLELRADNAAALRYYLRMGFAEMQRIAGYYGAGIDAQRMERRLRPAA